jgi:hypothetical protein
MEKLVFHSKEFHEILYLIIFRKFVQKIQVSLKSDKNNGLLYMKTYVNLWFYIAEFFFDREVIQSKFVEKIKHTFHVQ